MVPRERSELIVDWPRTRHLRCRCGAIKEDALTFPVTRLVVFLFLTGAACSATKLDRPSAPASVPASFGEAVTLDVGQSAQYADGLQVHLKKIDDSRCPPDVVCIWQGELAPLLQVGGGSLSAEQEVRLGTVRAVTVTAGRYAIALQEATTESATLVVSDRVAVSCRRSGCSGEICSDQDVASNCIYRPEFDCYKSATCEPQADRQCGWTETAELTRCLSDNAAEAHP